MRSLVLVLISPLILFCACSSSEKKSQENPLPPGEVDYLSSLERYSAKTSLYEGFLNVFEAEASFLNEDLLFQQLKRRSFMYGWSDSLYREEREKVQKEMGTSSQYFVSFYCPDLAYDDLDRPNSVWRIYLDVAGKRYQGTVSKLKTPPPELSANFPNFGRWHTPYLVSFKVPTAEIQESPTQLTVQGPMGSGLLKFPAMRSNKDL